MCVVYRSAITMPKDIMSEQQMNIEFVKEVQKHPTLFDYGLPTYSRKDVTDQAWEEVSEAMNMTPSACRERWRNLRAVFMRTMRAPPRGTGKKKPYYLAEAMNFIVPFLRPIATAEAAKAKLNQIRESEVTQSKETNIEDPILIKIENVDENEMEDWETLSNEDMTPNRKRLEVDHEENCPAKKICQIVQPCTSISNTEDEHVKSFLNSLVPELNEMDLVQFKNFKRRVLLLIDDIMSETPPSTSNKDNYGISTLCKTNIKDETF